MGIGSLATIAVKQPKNLLQKHTIRQNTKKEEQVEEEEEDDEEEEVAPIPKKARVAEVIEEKQTEPQAEVEAPAETQPEEVAEESTNNRMQSRK